MRALAKAARVRVMGFDVDGVLTDGGLVFGPEGDQLKIFSSQDGHGLKLLSAAGITVTVISGRRSAALAERARNLGVTHLHMGIEDKRACYAGLLATLGASFETAGYMGDDVVDLDVLRACGFSATVADGHAEVRRQVDYVARQPGGRGAVREVCDLLLAARRT